MPTTTESAGPSLHFEQRIEVLAALDAQIANAQSRYADELAAIRAECTHENVIETPGYSAGQYIRSYYEAMRMCLTCGAEEDGHNFRHLQPGQHDLQKVSRAKFYNLRKRGPRYVLGSS